VVQYLTQTGKKQTRFTKPEAKKPEHGAKPGAKLTHLDDDSSPWATA